MTIRLLLLAAPLDGLMLAYMQDHHRPWWAQVLATLPIFAAVMWPFSEGQDRR